MATSTLLEKIYINNPNALKEYLKAIETPIDVSKDIPSLDLCQNPETIKNMVAKNLQNLSLEKVKIQAYIGPTEAALDEADRQAAETDLRLTHKEVFNKLKKRT